MSGINRFTDTSRFWVIFDTCQLKKYYLDVHKLLALPPGAIIRYDYSSHLISTESLALLKNSASAPANVLLVYIQYEGYKRGDGLDYPSKPDEKLIAIGTRFAQLRLAPNFGDDGFAFDLEVQGYPKPDEDALNSILLPLKSKGETPWNKWVAISDKNDALAVLQSGNEADNWANIVKRLESSGTQFDKDVFWRLARPVLDGKKSVDVEYDSQFDSAPGGRRQVTYAYRLQEGHRLGFEVFSHSSLKTERQLKLEAKSEDSIQVEGSDTIDLRYDSSSQFVILGKRGETVDDRLDVLKLDSGEELDGWPVGPKLEINFRTVKSKPLTLVGVIFMIAALVSGALAESLWEHDPLSKFTGLVAAGLCAAIGSIIFYRKFAIKAD